MVAAEAVSNENFGQLDSLTKNLFQKLKYINRYTLSTHFLDHIGEQVSLFEDLHFLDASPFELFNYIIKKAIRRTSVRLSSTLEEALSVTKISVESKESRNSTTAGMREVRLVSNGTVINLPAMATSTLSFPSHIYKDGREVFAP